MTHFAGIKPGDTVLEVGCGAGRYTLLLAEMGVLVEGLDLAPKVLEQLRSFNDTGREIPLHAFDILDCPASMDGKYDSVIGFFVLHHVHDLQACFARMAQLVKRGGTLCFIEPNPRSPLYYVQIFCTPGMKWSEERGLLRMGPDLLEQEMAAAGLTRTAFKRFGFFPLRDQPAGGRALEAVFENVPIWERFLPFQMARAESTPADVS